MPRAVVEDNRRMSLRIRPEQKALLARAAALRHTDLTTFVTGSALREAESVIEEAERTKLSERDSLLVLDLRPGDFVVGVRSVAGGVGCERETVPFDL